MDKPRPRTMDIAAPRRPEASPARRRVTRRQALTTVAVAAVLLLGLLGAYWYRHRNDQQIATDRYQAVYMQTGQIYFGKLQNTHGPYLTLTHVFTLQGSSGQQASENTNIIQVMRQVYGPDDSMALRADQVQFWQNLRSDSKVAQAIASVDK